MISVATSRCKWCGEKVMTTGAYQCGTAGDRRSRECHRNCGETLKSTHRRKPVEEHLPKGRPRNCGGTLKSTHRRKPVEEHLPEGRPRSAERIQIEAMVLGSTLRYPASRRKSLRSLQCIIADRQDGTSLKVRVIGDEIVVNYVPRIDNMEVGESRLYTDDFDLIMRMSTQRNTRYLDGREDRAYCFDLVGLHYHLKRLR